MMISPAVSDGVRVFLDSYSRVWRKSDAAAIAAHWSAEHFRFYKAEEIDHFFVEWEDVKAYWRHNEAFHDVVSLDFPKIQLVPTGATTLIGIIQMRWDIRFAKNATLPDGSAFSHRGQAMGGDNHVLTQFEKTGDGWKLCGWSETPDAPITYMSRLYLANVKPAALD